MASNLNNAFDKFSQKNIGKTLFNKNDSQLNNPMNQINNQRRNFASQFGNNFNQSMGQNNIQNQEEGYDENGEQNQEQAQEQNQPDLVDKGVEAAGRAAASAYGGKLGEAAFDALAKTELGQKLLKKSSKKIKLYLYMTLAGIGVIIFLVVFLVAMVDNLMSNILNFTNWGEDDEEETEVITTTTSSNNNMVNTENSLVQIIGDDAVTSIETKIKDLNITECAGSNVANISVTLIDSLNDYNYKVPYSTYSNIDNQMGLVNSNWGGTFVENGETYTYGFNSLTFLAWAFGNTGINKIVLVDSLELYSDIININEVVPGDLFVYNDKALLVIENNGNSFKVAEASEDGLIYNTYTSNQLDNYKALSMENYYKDNCSI